MRTRMLAVLLVIVALGVSPARAHKDPNTETKRCDNWQRSGHTHDESDTSDVAPGDPLHSRVHSEKGNHFVTNDLGYVQVVGGSSYRGPDPQGNAFPGQGGFVQGEVDPVAGGPDADFNVAAFGPDADHPPTADPNAIATWVSQSYGSVCVNAAGQQQRTQTREP